MKRFLLTLFVFIGFFLVFDRMFYPILSISPNLELDKRLENVITGKLNKELLIIGSSLGARDIIAAQIEDSLAVSTFNLSYPGSDITFHEFLLRSVLKFNKKPKVILLTIDDPAEFYPNKSIKFRLDRLYPLSKYDYINDELISMGEKSILSKFLILERINKRNFDLRQKRFSALDSMMECGSMPISFRSANESFKVDTILHKYQRRNELEIKLKAFNDFQKLCLNNDIALILVFPPLYYNSTYGLRQRVQELVDDEARIFTYDQQNLKYKKQSYYYDQTHLKKNGAQIFTNELIEFLKMEQLVLIDKN